MLEALSSQPHKEVKVLRLGLPDSFVEHGAPHLLYDAVGLSAPKIAQRVAEWAGASRAKAPDLARAR